MTSSGVGEPKHLPMTPALSDYLLRSCSVPDPALSDLASRTAAVGEEAGMMVPVEQAALLTILTRILSARTVIDVGTFTGLSALALAMGIQPDGKVITCDVSDRWRDLAQEHWQRAGVAERIEFRLTSGGRLLRALSPDLRADLIFVDADKLNYPTYYELAVPLLRPGGLLVLDNVLLDGHVLAPDLAEEKLMRRCATVLRRLNATVAADQRVEAVMLPIADGLTIARKR